jgi:hypothetical protein
MVCVFAKFLTENRDDCSTDPILNCKEAKINASPINNVIPVLLPPDNIMKSNIMSKQKFNTSLKILQDMIDSGPPYRDFEIFRLYDELEELSKKLGQKEEQKINELKVQLGIPIEEKKQFCFCC